MGARLRCRVPSRSVRRAGVDLASVTTTNPMHQLISEAAAAQIAGEALSDEEALRVAARTATVFAGLTTTWPRWDLWECLEASSSSRDPEGWRRLGTLVGDVDDPVILLLDHADRWYGLALSSAGDVERLLSECTGFEVYVVSPSFERAACFNHHDHLIVANRIEQ